VRHLRFGPAIALGLAAGLLAGCGAGERDDTLTVFAAASLVDVLPKVAAAWKEAGGGQVRFSWGATSKLVPQVIDGAPADLLFSADEAWMDRLDSAGMVEPGTRTLVAGNRLVVVVPASGRAVVEEPDDLAGPAVGSIALAGETVPAGRYGKAALSSLGIWPAVESKIRWGDDVRVALRWAALDETDAAIVYRSDAIAEPRVRIALELPESSHPAIVYPAAVVRGSPRADAARQLLEFSGSPAARIIFEGDGFAPVGLR